MKRRVGAEERIYIFESKYVPRVHAFSLLSFQTDQRAQTHTFPVCGFWNTQRHQHDRFIQSSLDGAHVNDHIAGEWDTWLEQQCLRVAETHIKTFPNDFDSPEESNIQIWPALLKAVISAKDQSVVKKPEPEDGMEFIAARPARTVLDFQKDMHDVRVYLRVPMISMIRNA
jgi:hypothetical protein